jgi:tetratricopeptide (TPR) repeat protein
MFATEKRPRMKQHSIVKVKPKGGTGLRHSLQLGNPRPRPVADALGRLLSFFCFSACAAGERNLRQLRKKSEKRASEADATLTKEAIMRSSVDPGGPKSAAVAQPGKAPSQLEYFEQAMRLFHAREFHQARQYFEKAGGAGPDAAIRHKAELHLRMCDRRLAEDQVVLRSAEDHYNYAITQINIRNLGVAQQHLQFALEQEPAADHIYYALGLCHALAGNMQGAYENLGRAIELDPKNRISARQDADFAGYAGQPPLDALLFPEKKS